MHAAFLLGTVLLGVGLLSYSPVALRPTTETVVEEQLTGEKLPLRLHSGDWVCSTPPALPDLNVTESFLTTLGGTANTQTGVTVTLSGALPSPRLRHARVPYPPSDRPLLV